MLTPDMLRVIEEASPTDLEIQNNMAAVEECGSAGWWQAVKFDFRQIMKLYKGGEDECARAANIYQCGRDKAPQVTKAMQEAAASKISPVSFNWIIQPLKIKSLLLRLVS